MTITCARVRTRWAFGNARYTAVFHPGPLACGPLHIGLSEAENGADMAGAGTGAGRSCAGCPLRPTRHSMPSRERATEMADIGAADLLEVTDLRLGAPAWYLPPSSARRPEAVDIAANLLAEAVFTLPAGSRQGARQPADALDQLIRNLESGECVPFLGAGACEGHIPLGGPMARSWGDATGYPLHDKTNLPRVMQYIATTDYDGDATSLKRDFVAREFAGIRAPDFGDPWQIHGLLSRFALPLYVTTNYDDFMYLALQQSRKSPRRDHSRWYAGSAGKSGSPLSDVSYEPSPAEPLVFHMHGRYQEPPSLVLTEDDYIEYLVQLASDTQRQAGLVSGLLPAYVHGQLRSKPLLFVGYSLRDWTFLVLFRTLLHGIPDTHRRNHVSVQIDPRERSPRRAREYLERYLHAQHIQVFWSSASEFARELSGRLGGASS